MIIYYKFLRPLDADFGNKQRAAFDKMLVPPFDDPIEKYCYAEIHEEMFSKFLEDFPFAGRILLNRKEFPDAPTDIATGRDKKFIVVQPKKPVNKT